MTEPIFEATVDSHLLPTWAHRISTQLDHLVREIKTMSADQDKLDADVQALNTATSAISVELDALKAQVAAGGGNLDFSNLDAAVAKLQSIEPGATPTPAA